MKNHIKRLCDKLKLYSISKNERKMVDSIIKTTFGSAHRNYSLKGFISPSIDHLDRSMLSLNSLSNPRDSVEHNANPDPEAKENEQCRLNQQHFEVKRGSLLKKRSVGEILNNSFV